jgi:hypothetical protein
MIAKTRRDSFASFLRYAGIPHVATLKLTNTLFQFHFDDPENQCRRLEYEFFSGCAAVTDAMALLEADRELKHTIKLANASETGRWEVDKGKGKNGD